ncbi:trace amine-associated receptor 5-like [Exaiptasia diaphana]|uniref:G-protein coupled receptors family 1 profile domain-containing protein n=1 Tax=Exaiptasia diaphana TaxID=2652724 RepID=A0A913XTN4_EXADI|nr:trace amine-associated receptor 5-like [Exaiptasia diaphana]
MNYTKVDCMYKGSNFQDNVNFQSQSFQILSFLICVLGGVTSPITVAGNGLVVVALLRKQSLRTPTNILICSLALSDWLTGVCFIPSFIVYVSSLEHFNSCYFIGILFAFGWLGCGASFLGMVGVSFERYLALFLHLKYDSFMTVLRATSLNAISWSIPILVASLYLAGYFAISLIISITLLIPGLVVVAVIYLKIFLLVKKHRKQIQAQEISGNSPQAEKQRKLAVTIGMIVGVSFLCYLPIFIASLVAFMVNFTPLAKELLGFCSFLFTFSSFCNPFIYCHRNQEIRKAVLSCLSDLKRWFRSTIRLVCYIN